MGALSLMATCPGALEVGWMACDDDDESGQVKKHTRRGRQSGIRLGNGGGERERDHSPTEPGYPAKKSRGSDERTCEHLQLEGGFHTFHGEVPTWVGLLEGCHCVNYTPPPEGREGELPPSPPPSNSEHTVISPSPKPKRKGLSLFLDNIELCKIIANHHLWAVSPRPRRAQCSAEIKANAPLVRPTSHPFLHLHHRLSPIAHRSSPPAVYLRPHKYLSVLQQHLRQPSSDRQPLTSIPHRRLPRSRTSTAPTTNDQRPTTLELRAPPRRSTQPSTTRPRRYRDSGRAQEPNIDPSGRARSSGEERERVGRESGQRADSGQRGL